MSLVVVALSAMALVSCYPTTEQPAVETAQEVETEPSSWGPLAVVPPSQGGDSALIQGTLRVGEECLLLDERGENVLLVWPADRIGWDAESETVNFRTNRGDVVTLGDGDAVSFGGGGFSVEESGQTAEEFVAGLDWVSEPAPACVVDTLWFVYDLLP